MMRPRLMTLLAGAMFCVGCSHGPRPVDAAGEMPLQLPTPQAPFQVSGMRVQTVPATTFIYSEQRVTFSELADQIARPLADLRKIDATGKLPVLLIYHDPSEYTNKPFDLDVGLALSDAPPAVGDLKVRKLAPFRCAAAMYRGPMKLLPKAYDKLIPRMIASGLIPSDETREYYVHWESPDSTNNEVLIEVGIR